MPTPFPGMDPWLEHPRIWPDVHNALIAAVRNALSPRVRPRYFIRLEERAYLAEPDELVFVGVPDVSVGRPSAARGPSPSPTTSARSAPGAAIDVEVPVSSPVRETFLAIESIPDGEVVTVLELLSPANKSSAGRGRQLYERKRRRILASRTSLVEIDLLRAGAPFPVHGADRDAAYRILVSRGAERPRSKLYLFGVRDALPPFALPLRPGDDEPTVDVGGVLRDLYDVASYDLTIDYSRAPLPPLTADDVAWADALLRHAGLRTETQ